MLENIDKIVGTKIKEFRILAGITQGELAEKIGVTYQQVQKYEKGACSISVRRLFAIADALSISIKSFFEDMPLVEEQKKDYALTKECIEIARFIDNIQDKKIKDSIIQLIKVLSDEK